MNSYDRAHNRSVAEADKRVRDILDAYERDITRLARTVSVPEGRAFRFEDYPPLRERYDRLIRDLHGAMTDEIQVREKREWERANDKNDDFAVEVIGSQAEATARGYMKRNTEALEAFMARKVAGMTLSDRVWKYTGQYSTEIQDAIDVALRDGASADELSREVRKYLQEPNRLFRRVRDEHGALHLSKNAKAYHPGQGVYRSSYMNARRLATTEINMAYRASDYTRYQQLDFVVGIEVHLSGNHNCKGVPAGMFFDICDELKGRYPKGFQFTGWHPNCRCYTTTILKTKEEMKLDAARIRQGEAPAEGSVNTVEQLPEGFTKWLSDNQQRIEDAKRLPYFLTQNGHRESGLWVPFERVFPKVEMTVPEKAAKRQAARTSEQVKDIKDRWNERSEALKALEDLEKEYGSMVDYDSAKFESLYGKYGPLLSSVKSWRSSVDGKISSLTALDNPKKWAEKFSLSELEAVNDAVAKKLKSFNGFSLQGKKDKLEFEIEWVEDHKKYKTWEVAQAAYKKELAAVEEAIVWDEAKTRYGELKGFKTYSPIFKSYMKEYREAYAARDKAAAEAALDKAEAKRDELMSRGRKKKASQASGIGLRDGETIDELVARLGKDCPETLKELSVVIKEFQYNNPDFIAKQAEINRVMKKLFDDNDFGMDIKHEYLESVLDRGFLNTFQTGTSLGYHGSSRTTGAIETDHKRLRISHRMFTTGFNSSDRKNGGVNYHGKQFAREDYEKYGHLVDRDKYDGYTRNLTHYGDVQVRFKKENVLTTWTFDDSLHNYGEYFQPSLTSDPQVGSFDEMLSSYRMPSVGDKKKLWQWQDEKGTSYIELQYHGTLTADDVESLVFGRFPEALISKDVLKRWLDKGVEIYYVDRGSSKLIQYQP